MERTTTSTHRRAPSRLTDRRTVPRPAGAAPSATTATPEFPGCRPIHISRDGIADYEGRLEYWEADTETAWVVRAPVSVWHELPGQRLARLAERIASVRGAAIETVGNADLLLRTRPASASASSRPTSWCICASRRSAGSAPPSKSAGTNCRT